MSARIRTRLFSGGVLVPGAPVLLEQSRDDLRKGYEVECYSFEAATTYQWTLAFTPDSAGNSTGVPDDFAGTPSAAVWDPVAANTQTAKFTVDWDGSYLVRLVVDAGLPTESVQFIRCRALTRFGELKLVAAGERRDATGVVPVDASQEGWTDDANQNLLRLAAFVRRTATSGRVLYVDANKGRDSSSTANDPTNIIQLPGPDSANREETGIKVKSEGFGDFSDVTSAIAYASGAVGRGEPALSATEPYIILVKPGLYLENLTIPPFVYIVAEQSLYTPSSGGVVIRAAGGGQFHTYAATAASDYALLAGLTLDNDTSSADPVLVHDGGKLDLSWCSINQRRASVAHVPGLKVDGSTWDAECRLNDCVVTTAATGNAAFAISTEGASAYLKMDRCYVAGPSILSVNDPHSGSSVIYLDSTTLASVSGYGIKGYPAILELRNSVVEKTGVPGVLESILIGPYTGTGLAVTVDLQDTLLKYGDFSFDPTDFVGSADLFLSNLQTQGGDIVFPLAPAAGSVPSITYRTLGKSLGYNPAWVKPETTAVAVPAAVQLTDSPNVQDAIDQLVNLMFPAGNIINYGLDTAYDGLASINPPAAGVGLGRVITADAGAVKVGGATSPLYEEADGLLRGGIQAEGIIDLGPHVADGLGSEINLNPDFAGAGPFIRLGRATFPTNGDSSSHHGLPAAVLQAGRAGVLDADASYNLLLRTRNRASSSTEEAGRVVLDGGTVPGGDNLISGGSIYIQGGWNHNTNAPNTGSAGDVYLVPGHKAAVPSSGKVYLVDPSTATKASLTAGAAFIGGVTGSIWLATPNGIEEFAILAANNLAAVIATINGTSEAILASDAAGTLKLECQMPGPNGDVLFVRDDQAGALNTALGNLIPGPNPGDAVLAPGTYPDKVELNCTGNQVLSVGTTLPIILDGTTGKLTVPGIIDPIALILDETAGGVDVPIAAGKGALFVSDGTGGRVLNHLYYKDSGGGFVDLSAGGGGGGGGPLAYNRVSKVAADSPYAVGATDYYIGVDTAAGAVTVTLPALAACADGRTLVIKDEGGVAGGGNAITIAVDGGGGYTIEAGISPINVNGGSVTLYYNSAATKWFAV